MKRYAGAARLYLLTVWLMILGSVIVSQFQTTNALVMYSLSAVFVTLMAIYIPAVIFTRKANPPEFGTRKITLVQGVLSVALGVGAYLVMTGIANLVYSAFSSLELFEAEASMPSLLSFEGAALFFLIAIFAPIAEERFFRASLLFSWLVMGRVKVVLLTSALFALLHVDPLSFPSLLFSGVILGFAAYDSRSVYPAMIIHITINSASLILSEIVPASFSIFSSTVLDALLFIALGIIIIVLFYGAFKKRAVTPPAPITKDELKDISAAELQKRGYTVEDLPGLFPEISIRKRVLRPPLMLATGILLYLNIVSLLVIFGVIV